MTRTVDSYIEVGFSKVATMKKDTVASKKKHNVDVVYKEGFDPKGKIGVYIIAKDNQPLKIGESENLYNRFQCYESHTGRTNSSIRFNMVDNDTYDIWFIECPHYTVGFAGVFVNSGISYKQLEKQLLRQYKETNGNVPVWNKGIQ